MRIHRSIFGYSLVSAILVAAFSTGAFAAIVKYTDRTTWENAVASFETEGFTDSTEGGIPHNTIHDVGGFSVFYTTTGNANDTNNAIHDGTTLRLNPIPNDRFLRLEVDFIGTDTTSSLKFIFDSPITAFGSDWNGLHTEGVVKIEVEDTTIVLADELGPAPDAYFDTQGDGGFFGVTFDTPTTEIEFVDLPPLFSDSFGLDDVVFGTTIPEPTSLLMALVLGGVILCAFGRRRRAPAGGVT